MAEYVLDAGSKLEIWTYKDGLLARMAHDLCIAVTEAESTVQLDGDRYVVELKVPVQSFQVRGQVKRGTVTPLKPKDHREIAENIRSAAVLDAARHPRIEFQGEGRAEKAKLSVDGQLSIRGTTRPLRFTTRLTKDGEAFGIDGEVQLQQTSFGIKPFSALMGALKVKDGIRISWSLRYRPL